jgi:predicted Fe-Mo cluster-binding NifX family protein
MNVAITVWGNRISPVFDAAQTLLVAAVQDGRVLDRKTVNFRSGYFSHFLGLVEEMDVQVLICGALCKGPVKAIEAKNIEVLPFMTGEVETVLEIFISGADLTPFFMPGCGDSRCCRRQIAGIVERGGDL